MLRSIVRTLLLRELATVRRSVDAYPDDASVWAERDGLPNSGGTLVLHIAGNLQHYVGARLGDTGYRRDRDAEFARRDVPRAELRSELDAAIAAVERGLARVTDEMLTAPYAEPIAGRTLATGDVLAHLAAHLAYHLGQLDYHRRSVTGDVRGVSALSPAVLPEHDAARGA